MIGFLLKMHRFPRAATAEVDVWTFRGEYSEQYLKHRHAL